MAFDDAPAGHGNRGNLYGTPAAPQPPKRLPGADIGPPVSTAQQITVGTARVRDTGAPSIYIEVGKERVYLDEDDIETHVSSLLGTFHMAVVEAWLTKWVRHTFRSNPPAFVDKVEYSLVEALQKLAKERTEDATLRQSFMQDMCMALGIDMGVVSEADACNKMDMTADQVKEMRVRIRRTLQRSWSRTNPPADK